MKAPIILIVAYVIFIATVFPTQAISEDLIEGINDSLIALFCLFGATLLYQVSLRFNKSDGNRTTWSLFALGLFCEGIGHVIYSIAGIVIGPVEDFPHVSDIIIAIGGVLYIVSLSRFLIDLVSTDLLPPKRYMWIANAVFALYAAVFILLVILPVTQNYEVSVAMRAAYLVYPIIDSVIVFLCIHLALIFLSMGQSPMARPWMILVIAFLVFALTDSAFAYYHLILDEYHPYLWINPGWGLAYLLIMLGASKQLYLMSQWDSIGSDDIDLSFFLDEKKPII